MGKEWSKYQQAIFSVYENTKSNLFIKATAGASKTTCMLECLKRTSPVKTKIFLAFNKSIADELKTKVPLGAETSTFHSKGLKILLQNYRVKFKVNENKAFGICKKILVLDDIPAKQQPRYIFELQEIWNQIRVNLFVNYPVDIPAICIEKDFEFKERMIDDIEDLEKEWMKGMKKISQGEFQMDFTDMLWVPYLMIAEEDFPKYDIVFIDEGQDLNVLQREIALRLVKPKKGRFVIVGDFSQAIYGFQGASVDNFEVFQKIPNTMILPLSITYRCAKRIVEEAKTVFPDDIEASPWAEEGVVRKGTLGEAQSGDFVLCRNNLPLVAAFIVFLKLEKKATIKGKELGESLLLILDKISDIKDLDTLLEAKLEELVKKGMSRVAALNNPSYIVLEEKCMILRLLYNQFPSMIDLCSTIEKIFTENTEGIVLCTCHKSKGLEADRVFFLNPELIPSQYAKTEKALYGEKCLKFVAITRARKELVYCNI